MASPDHAHRRLCTPSPSSRPPGLLVVVSGNATELDGVLFSCDGDLSAIVSTILVTTVADRIVITAAPLDIAVITMPPAMASQIEMAKRHLALITPRLSEGSILLPSDIKCGRCCRPPSCPRESIMRLQSADRRGQNQACIIYRIQSARLSRDVKLLK